MQNDPEVESNKRMARLSVILGIFGMPTCGLFGFGGLVGIWLGERAYKKSKKSPEKYGGKGVALAGIIINSLAIAIGILVFLTPTLFPSKRSIEVISPEGRLRTIATAELRYFEVHRRYGALKELADLNFIDSSFASTNLKDHYNYTIEITEKPPTFCAHADRAEDTFGESDFNVSEDWIIRYISSKQRGTVPRGTGEPIINK